MRRLYPAFFVLFLTPPFIASAQQTAAPPVATPSLVSPSSASGAQSRISLDVLVTDKAGKPIAGLEPPDFTLLDNGQPRKILGFRRTDGTVGNKLDPPVEVIIVVDAVNLSYQAITQQRLRIGDFLHRNGGHLAQPVSIFLFTNQGLRVQPQPSRDGNALVAVLGQFGPVRSMGSESGVFGDVERLDTSVQTMATIADNEARKPGRKMLIWIGPGWPWLVGSRYVQSNESRQSYFRSIVQLSKKLREARISLYSIYTLLGTGVVAHAAYAKPVRDPRKADPANLGLQVLATQTGGRVLDPSNDLAGQIENCIADIGTYYTLSFAPPPAAQVDEYHDLKVQASQPGSSVRTYTGYYDQP